MKWVPDETTRKRILKPNEAAKLIDQGAAYKAMIGVMLFAGLRISEALGLTWGDVDLQGRMIHVWRQLAYRREDVTVGALRAKAEAKGVDIRPKSSGGSRPAEDDRPVTSGDIMQMFQAHAAERAKELA